MNGSVSRKTGLSKRRKKQSAYRRIAAGNISGKSLVQSDEQLLAYEFKTVPGYKHTLIWVNPTTPDLLPMWTGVAAINKGTALRGA